MELVTPTFQSCSEAFSDQRCQVCPCGHTAQMPSYWGLHCLFPLERCCLKGPAGRSSWQRVLEEGRSQIGRLQTRIPWALESRHFSRLPTFPNANRGSFPSQPFLPEAALALWLLVNIPHEGLAGSDMGLDSEHPALRLCQALGLCPARNRTASS